jgi:hypothetical protein
VVALLRALASRVVRAVEAGKGDAATIARRPSTPPRALAFLAAKAMDEVAENPRTLLEDLGGGKKPSASKASATTVGTKKPTRAAKVTGPSPAKEIAGRVPCLRVTTKGEGKPEPVDRSGGLPSPWGEEPWPECESCLRPMTFAVQLIGKAAGGQVDLGSAAALQVFVCAGDPCASDEPLSGTNAALLRRTPLGEGSVPAPKPQHGDLEAPQRIVLTPGTDDARLRDDTWWERDEAAYDAARDEANGEKIHGVMLYGNPPSTVKCPECRLEMVYLARFYHVKEIIGGTVFLHICPDGHAASYQSVR